MNLVAKAIDFLVAKAIDSIVAKAMVHTGELKGAHPFGPIHYLNVAHRNTTSMNSVEDVVTNPGIIFCMERS